MQPDLFIRVRKGFEPHVKALLNKEGVVFKDEGNGCLALPNGTRLETIFPQQNWCEVQDLSSQQTAALFQASAMGSLVGCLRGIGRQNPAPS